MTEALLESEIVKFIRFYWEDCFIYIKTYLEEKPIKFLEYSVRHEAILKGLNPRSSPEQYKVWRVEKSNKFNWHFEQTKNFDVAYIDELLNQFIQKHNLSKAHQIKLLNEVLADFEKKKVDFSCYDKFLNEDYVEINYKVELQYIKTEVNNTLKHLKEKLVELNKGTERQPAKSIMAGAREETHSYFIKSEFFIENPYLEHFETLSEYNFTIKEYPFKVPVYSTKLRLILNSKEIPAWNTDENKDEFINGQNYIALYIKKFIEGVKYFDENFALTTDTLYGTNSDKYIRTLHVNYFHTGGQYSSNGWGYVKNIRYEAVNRLIISEYGYYSGIVSRVEELKKKHPLIFKDFEICRHEPIKETETKPIKLQPKVFEDLFINPNDAEFCLNILRQLENPVIDEQNNYIGKNKGVFPLWVKVLKSYSPKPLIGFYKDEVYKDLLNEKIIGLNLSKDASEFRKEYARLIKNQVELEIKTVLSQLSQSSQSGKLGK